MKKTMLLFFFLIYSCQKKEAAPEQIANTLNGSWSFSLGCFDTGVNHSKAVVTYNNGSGTSVQNFYSDSICTDANVLYKTESLFVYVENGVVTNPSDAVSINFTSGLISLTPLTSAGVTSLNASNTCGFNNWVLNTSKDITGICGYGAANVTTYSIYNITGSTLKFGKTSGSFDGTNDANRHNVYDTAYYYTRQ